jgi:hypothetical protein
MTGIAQAARSGHEQADAWAAQAREHWEAGRLAEAAAYNHACRQVDPHRSPLWRSRSERLLEAASRQSLAVQNAVRLAVAGITAADPGLHRLAAHNAELVDPAADCRWPTCPEHGVRATRNQAVMEREAQ